MENKKLIIPFLTTILFVVAYGIISLDDGRLLLHAQSAAMTTPPPLPKPKYYMPLLVHQPETVVPSLTPSPTGTNISTATPTATNTPNLTRTSTATPTVTNTPTATRLPGACPVRFEGLLEAGDSSVGVTGDFAVEITVIDLATSEVLAEAVIDELLAGHYCPGFKEVEFPAGVSLTLNHVILVDASDGSFDVAIVQPQQPTATPTPISTETPIPSDLIVSPPTLVSTPPIVANQPVSFTVMITNTSMVDVNNLFFVDIFFDVLPSEITPTGIPLVYSGAYSGVSGLSAGSSRVITITSLTGFTGDETERTVYSMVDSVQQIGETDETNNIGGMITVQVTPVPTIPPTPTVEAVSEVSGIVRTSYFGPWAPQGRSDLYLVLIEPNATPNGRETLMDRTRSALNTGFYRFLDVQPPPTEDDYYLVVACFYYDDKVYVGERPYVIPTNQFANVYMFLEPHGCPPYR